MKSLWLVFYQGQGYGIDAVDEEDAIKQHNQRGWRHPDANNLEVRQATSDDWNDLVLNLGIAEDNVAALESRLSDIAEEG